MVEQVSARRGLLVWWHLLSLDAPTVAALWTWFVARMFGAREQGRWPLAMFLAVWVLYAGDRVLDARGSGALEERHRFHWRHRWGFSAGMIGCGLGLVALHLVVPRGVLWLGVALVAWLGAVHLSGRAMPKEWGVGVFFAAAVFLPVLSWRTVPACVGFAVVCAVNCLYIHGWEDAGWNPWGLRRVNWLVGAVVIAACCGGPVMWAEGLAAALLWWLNRSRAGMDRTSLRAIADAALLTPLLFLGWTR